MTTCASAPRANMLPFSSVLVCLAAAQVVVAAASHGPRTVPPPPPGLPPAEAASRCCGPPSALPPQPPLGHPGPERCCGRGWGLHCCIGTACCFGDVVLPHGLPQPTRAAAARPPSAKPGARALYGSDPWWKDWAQWLNLGIVLAVVALVGGVLTCCCHRLRQDKAFLVRQQRLLGDSGLFNYGTAGYHPSAPHWNTPGASRWVDFSSKPPKSSMNPVYRQGPMVSQYYPHPAGV